MTALGHRPRTGGLFEGYGGLDLAVANVFDSELAWYAEFDGLPTEKKPFLHGASRILAHRFPGVVNHGDVTKIDWALLRGSIEIMTGGSPCQDLSHAGKRAGMTEGTRSNLWVAMREGIAIIRPSIVIWENVRGAFTAEADSDLVADPRLLAEVRRRDGEPVLRAAGRVVGDLSELGYDSGHITIRAADIGAPHGRPRVFLVATDTTCDPWWLEHGDGGAAGYAALLRRDEGGDARHGGGPGQEPPRSSRGSGGADRRAAAEDADVAAGGERRLAAPGQAEGGRARADAGRRGGDLLPAELKTLPTPSARDYKDHTIRLEPHRPDDKDTLARALTDVPAAGVDPGPLLPTPAVNDMGASYTPEEWDAWTDRMKAAHGNGNGHGKSLSIEAARLDPLLPTPNTSDATGAGSAASRDAGSQAQLHDTVRKVAEFVAEATDEELFAVEDIDDEDDFELALLPTPSVALATGGQTSRSGDRAGEPLLGGISKWGPYAPAIARWEALLGRPAPEPTMQSKKGRPQLSPRFVEWMMGLPDGWVCDVPGITRNEALKALGNGVCPQQATAAISTVLSWFRATAA